VNAKTHQNENKELENSKIASEAPENTTDENLNRSEGEADSQSNEPNTQEELQVNKEALGEQQKLYSELKSEIDDINTDVDTLDDIKHQRKSMVDLKERVLALFLIPKPDKDSSIDLIQEKFDVLQKKSDDIKGKISEEYDKNLQELEPKVKTVLSEVEKEDNFSEIRKKLINLQSEIKEARLHSNHKDDFFSMVQDAFESLSEKQEAEREKYEMEISDNYLRIKPKVAEAIKFAVQTENFNDARQKLIEVQNELKQVKLKKDHLDELFGVIRKAFDVVNSKQDQEREKFREEAEKEYIALEPIIQENIEFAKTSDDYEKARTLLIDSQKLIKSKNLTRKQRDDLYGKIREVFNVLNEKSDANREEFVGECNENYANLEIKVNEAIAYIDFTNHLNDIREGLLAVQDEVKIVKLTRSQRNELFKRIRDGFAKFDEKRNKFIEKRKQREKSDD
jgi:DNA repair exonuclease SbcCD ATPase subunit